MTEMKAMFPIGGECIGNGGWEELLVEAEMAMGLPLRGCAADSTPRFVDALVQGGFATDTADHNRGLPPSGGDTGFRTWQRREHTNCIEPATKTGPIGGLSGPGAWALGETPIRHQFLRDNEARPDGAHQNPRAMRIGNWLISACPRAPRYQMTG